MKRSALLRTLVVGACVAATVQCGDDDGITDAPPVTLGQTTFVVVVNPTVNVSSQSVPFDETGNANVPAPGSARADVVVSADGGPVDTTGPDGLAVLPEVTPGARTLSLSGGGSSGQLAESILEGDLEEIAVALDAGGASVMAEVAYRLGGQVVEITPSTPIDSVNALLSQSNIIVFFRGGQYNVGADTIVFSGSDLTLFGEGPQGGQVTIVGEVLVQGSRNRMRGVLIQGDLTVEGSFPGISFSRVEGAASVSGSSALLLNNEFCGIVSLTGSSPVVIGNAGIEPIARPSDCP